MPVRAAPRAAHRDVVLALFFFSFGERCVAWPFDCVQNFRQTQLHTFVPNFLEKVLTLVTEFGPLESNARCSKIGDELFCPKLFVHAQRSVCLLPSDLVLDDQLGE